MSTWFWIWLVAAVVLSVAEIFTAGFFMLPFGLGAAVAAVLALLGIPVAVQWVAFLGVSLLLLFAMRSLSSALTHEPPQQVAGDRLLGKGGSVLERIDNHAHTGRVRVEREEWLADGVDDVIVEVGQRVTVTGVEGAHLLVVPADSSDKRTVAP